MAESKVVLLPGEIDYQLLARKIVEKRKIQKLSLRQAAEQCGNISYSTLSRLERGTAQPDLDTLKRALAWLDIPPSSLFMGAQVMRAHLRAQKNLASSVAEALAEVARLVQSKYYETSPEAPDTPHQGKTTGPYRRLRLSVRERLAVQFRQAINWKTDEPLDSFNLQVAGVQVKKIDEIPGIPPSTLGLLLGPYRMRWSAITLPINDTESAWLIILNSRHTPERQRATLMEELCHILLGHHLTTISHFEGQTFRDYNDDQERDAYALGAAILLPREPLAERIRRGEPVESVARHFGVSQELVEYRIKVTGAWFEYKFRQSVKPGPRTP